MVPLGVEGAIIGTALYVGNFTLEEALQAARTTTTEERTAHDARPPPTPSAVPATRGPAPAAQRLDGRLRDLLAGKKIVITGVTGFIGEQLLWKILTELPDTKPSVLVRRKGSAGARDRVISRAQEADLRRRCETRPVGRRSCWTSRIEVIEGDLPNVPELPADLDIVVHCAGDVSFDPPIDQAFTTNVVGTQNADGADARGGHRRRRQPDEGPALRAHLHRVHRRPPPRRHPRRLRTSTRSTTGWRPRPACGCATCSRPSRVPRNGWPALRKLAEREHRQAGYLTTAADTERRRLEWVQSELVKAGTERARSLGWTDVYTFTKALGERVVVEVGADIAVSIVRPAIVESSW